MLVKKKKRKTRFAVFKQGRLSASEMWQHPGVIFQIGDGSLCSYRRDNHTSPFSHVTFSRAAKIFLNLTGWCECGLNWDPGSIALMPWQIHTNKSTVKCPVKTQARNAQANWLRISPPPFFFFLVVAVLFVFFFVQEQEHSLSTAGLLSKNRRRTEIPFFCGSWQTMIQCPGWEASQANSPLELSRQKFIMQNFQETSILCFEPVSAETGGGGFHTNVTANSPSIRRRYKRGTKTPTQCTETGNSCPRGLCPGCETKHTKQFYAQLQAWQTNTNYWSFNAEILV